MKNPQSAPNSKGILEHSQSGRSRRYAVPRAVNVCDVIQAYSITVADEKKRRRSVVPVPSALDKVKKRAPLVTSSAGLVASAAGGEAVGPILRILTELIPSRHERRTRDFLRDVEDRLTQLEVDVDALGRSEHFHALVARVVVLLFQDYQKEKLDAYRAILLNAAVNPIEPTLEELYLIMTGRLTALSLVVLREIDCVEPLPERTGTERKTQVTFAAMWRGVLPGVPLDTLKPTLELLHREGLVRDTAILLDRHTALNDGDLRVLSTSLGQGFMSFVLREP